MRTEQNDYVVMYNGKLTALFGVIKTTFEFKDLKQKSVPSNLFI